MVPGDPVRRSALVDLNDAALTVGVSGLERRSSLPALPECIDVFEALIEGRCVHRELREGNRDRHRHVREGRRIAAKHPLAAI